MSINALGQPSSQKMQGAWGAGLFMLDKQMVSIKNVNLVLPVFYKGMTGRILGDFLCVLPAC